MKKIFCLGQGIIDYVIKGNSFNGIIPHKNNEVNIGTIEQIIRENQEGIVYKNIGGAVLNTSINMGYLGLENYIVLSIGEKDIDFFSQNLKEISNVIPIIQKNFGKNTGKVITFIPKNKDVNFLNYTNAFCYECANNINLNDEIKEKIKDSFLLYLSLYSFHGEYIKNNEKILNFTKKNLKKIAIDAGGCKNNNRKDELIEIIKEYANFLFVNEAEFDILNIGKFMDRLMDNNCMIIKKLGKEGSIIFYDKKREYIPSKKIDVANSLGAGDAYASGFLFGLLKGYSIKNCGYLGTCVSQEIIRRVNLRLNEKFDIPNMITG